jgi:hypothetical protein
VIGFYSNNSEPITNNRGTVLRYTAILQVGGDHSLEPAAALACTRTQYFVLAVSLLITTRVELVAHVIAGEVDDGIGAFLERLELVEREKWRISGFEICALFLFFAHHQNRGRVRGMASVARRACAQSKARR